MSELTDRLKAACNGHPSAKIAWPHNLLHDAIRELDRKDDLIKELVDLVDTALNVVHLSATASVYGDLVDQSNVVISKVNQETIGLEVEE